MDSARWARVYGAVVGVQVENDWDDDYHEYWMIRLPDACTHKCEHH